MAVQKLLACVVFLVLLMPRGSAEDSLVEASSAECVEGTVVVEFTVSESGSAVDLVVITSQPEGVHDEAALAAIRDWNFKDQVKSLESRRIRLPVEFTCQG